MADKQRAVVVFPGRGSYASGELGYLQRYHADRMDMVAALDTVRAKSGATAAIELDAMEKFSPSRHLPGRNASNLIYTCALADFAAIDRNAFEVVAVCGNSLGWYLALAAAGSLALEDGAHLVDTMGGLMEREGVGGQLLCPIAREDWRVDEAARDTVLNVIAATPNAYLSIDLGGTLVLAGDNDAIKALQAELRAPDGSTLVQLPKHAAFHTPLLEEIAAMARGQLPETLFRAPDVPMIDGRGVIWSPSASDTEALHSYTLGTQIVETYDFAKSIEVALKEFAPDKLILAGPGSALGGPLGQCLIRHAWHDIFDRAGFLERQSSEPYLLAMGREEQRSLVTP